MNGNTTWGTAQPNGKVKVDQWLDGSSAPAFASAGVLAGAGVVPVANSLQADIGGVAGTDDFVFAKNTQSDGVVLGNHVATPTRLTFTAPGTSGQSQVFTVLVWKSASIVGTSQNGVEEVSKPIFVAGTPAATGSQTAPTDSQIRSALGATPNDFIGPIADITIANGQTILLMSNIVRRQSTIPSSVISGTIPADKVGQLNSAFGTNAGFVNFNTSSAYTGLAQAQITLSQPTKVQISASARYNLASNQESNIRIWDATTNASVFEEGNISSVNDLVRSSSYTIQATLAAGTHNLQIQVRGFNGSAGTHTVPVNNATISVFSLGA